ncbi:MAG TPA: TIGR02281 family clan AA aspartic protease [Burkholderiales bacterium]|nr:TIGR02281 family clan AA aspartic protease [Burkholderiales bacterium]
MTPVRALTLSVALVSLPVTQADAATVMVMSLAGGRAELIINGTTVRTLRDGQSAPEGVVLVSATPEAAVIETDGKRYTLRLGQGTISTVVLKANAGGLFLTTAYINGVPVQVVVDTGASTVAINRAEAGRMGIDYASGQRVVFRTANGATSAWRVTLASVQVGEIVLSNVAAAVMEGGAEQLPIVLLGSTFLQHVDVQRDGDTLTLTKRW